MADKVLGSNPKAWALPATLGRYELLERLGQGGMGSVFLARDTKLGWRVALKIPHFTGEERPDLIKRFELEARVLAELDHPNICQVRDVGEIEGTHYLVMKYIEGKTLEQAIAPGKPMKAEQAVKIVRKLALALQVAHARGIFHRDLKPSNIMVTSAKDLVIMDFGLARQAESDAKRLTQAGLPLGTPHYMAPEQVEASHEAMGAGCDIYSLGVILYELLAGRRPFDGPITRVLGLIMVQPPPPISEFRPTLDPELERICMKALEKQPECRQASMEALAGELGNWLAGRSGESSSAPSLGDSSLLESPPSVIPETVRPEPARPPREPGWRPPRWLVTTVLANLVVVLGVIFYIQTDQGTVKIEIDDPSAVVKVDGRRIQIENLAQPLTLRTGPHELEVTYGDLHVEARSFTVRRGELEPVRVSYTPKPDDRRTETKTAEQEKPKPPVDPPSEPVEKVAAKPAAPALTPAEGPPAKAEPKAAPEDPPKPRTMSAGTRTPEERDDNALKLVLCWCPAGSFKMGSPTSEPGRNKDDETQVDVTLSQGFWMGKYEVTQDQWQRVMGTTLAQQKAKDGVGDVVGEGPNHPMYFVNHTEAEEFCRKLTESERAAGRLVADWEYRLPTEAQWEYACRAGTTTATAFGDQLSSTQANFDGMRPYNGAKVGPYEKATVPVGKYPGNGWGLHDMHGNVWEWCRDGYDAKLPGGVDPGGPGGALQRVLRGGGWISLGESCRAASRGRSNPVYRFDNLGFRVAAVPKGAKNK